MWIKAQCCFSLASPPPKIPWLRKNIRRRAPVSLRFWTCQEILKSEEVGQWCVLVRSVNVDAFAASARLVSSVCFHHQPAFHVYRALWFPLQHRPLHQVIITEAKEEWFSDWKDAKQGRRGKDYEQMKQRFQDSNSYGGNWHKSLWLSLMLVPGINGESLRKSLYPTSRLRRCFSSSWLDNPPESNPIIGDWGSGSYNLSSCPLVTSKKTWKSIAWPHMISKTLKMKPDCSTSIV